MRYPYLCPNCGHRFEVIKRVSEIDNEELCPECSTISDRKIALSQGIDKSAASDWNTPHYNPGLGKHFTSNSQARKYARKQGLEEVGDEPIDKIHKKFDNERKQKRKARWDSINMDHGEIRS